MITLGTFNKLTILRHSSVGLFLGDDDIDDLLLPNKYVPEEYEIGDSIEVFCYLDHEERPVATTQHPLVQRGGFAFLEVVEVNEYGAFLNWGLEKHLFCPFREQAEPMVAGQAYVVHCYLDEKSFRLAASSKVAKFLDKETAHLRLNQKVSLLAFRRSELGVDMIVDQRYRGLLFADQIFRDISLGDTLTGYVKAVRPDGKVDLSLQPLGAEKLEPASEQILSLLRESDGYLGLHDGSAPEVIKQQLQMSKKTFKKAVGNLYKKRIITLEKEGIRLI